MSDNAAAALTDIYNAFSLYGLKNCYRIVVRHNDLAKAKEALGLDDAESGDKSEASGNGVE